MYDKHKGQGFAQTQKMQKDAGFRLTMDGRGTLRITTSGPSEKPSGPVSGKNGGQDTKPAQIFDATRTIIKQIDEASDSKTKMARLYHLVNDALGGNPYHMTALLQIANNHSDQVIQQAASVALLERFSSQDGILLHLAMRSPFQHIRKGALAEMESRGKLYLLTHVSERSAYSDTRSDARKLLEPMKKATDDGTGG